MERDGFIVKTGFLVAESNDLQTLFVDPVRLCQSLDAHHQDCFSML